YHHRLIRIKIHLLHNCEGTILKNYVFDGKNVTVSVFQTVLYDRKDFERYKAGVFSDVLEHVSHGKQYAVSQLLSKFIKACERELVEFLAEEIVAEKKVQKKETLPKEIGGFQIKLNGADIEMEKITAREKILISFNINHTVDAEDEAEITASGDKPEFAEMKSKPQFEVDIVKGTQTLSFTCSFLRGEVQEGEYNDVFGIDEITLFEGEWSDKTYAVAGDVLDGYLYDLLMNLLEEKGISNEFVEKLSNFSTYYEHSSYIELLEGISKFTISENK
ncbi:complement component 1 Q subcomponent-binding protein, mitochondrial, partial [Sabethes cyaneus]|uniref:complement component 1 Q subcomponent-binding protein, mitochondrial n=1 Tax=Sabethes cyaneus TaxID=53552 RepID=UPI00237DF17D